MFFIYECIFYILFLLIDTDVLVISLSSSVIKYIAVISCFIYIVYQYIRKHTFSLSYILIFILILIADYFLLFTSAYLLGVLVFCSIQCMYQYLLQQKITILTFLIAIVTIILGMLNQLFLIAICYTLLSIQSIYIAYYKKKNLQTLKYQYLFKGLLLLGCCDICVAIQYVNALQAFQSIIGIAIWFFYLPSLLCIVRSDYV